MEFGSLKCFAWFCFCLRLKANIWLRRKEKLCSILDFFDLQMCKALKKITQNKAEIDNLTKGNGNLSIFLCILCVEIVKQSKILSIMLNSTLR